MREYREKIYRIICAFAILASLLLHSCTSNKEYDQLMAKADSLMSVDDDSAHVALQMLNGADTEKLYKSYPVDFYLHLMHTCFCPNEKPAEAYCQLLRLTCI